MTRLDWFALTFREEFPTWVRSPLNLEPTNLFFNDTQVVAIIGEGRRIEVLVTVASGDETEGEPVNFDRNNEPSARFFQTASYPVDPDNFRVFRGRNGQSELAAEDYFLQAETGQFVVFEPLVAGEQLRVDYISMADVNFPRLYTADDPLAVEQIYGSPSTTNTLSAGASLAFANGAQRVVVVQSDHTGADPFSFGALNALARQQVYYIVPMQNGNYADQIVAAVDHAQQMSLTPNRRERFVVSAELLEFDSRNNFPRDASFDFAQEERLLLGFADFATTVFGGETAEANGGFLAAAIAGRWASSEYPAYPITRKELVNIVLNWPNQELYTEAQVREFVQNGLTYVRRNGNATQIYQGRTTIIDGPIVEEEPSIWRIRDFVAIQVRARLEDRFVGTPLLPRVADDVAETTTALLESLVEQKILRKFSGVRARVDDIEPRQMNVEFDIEPVFPLNDIVVRMNVVSFL